MSNRNGLGPDNKGMQGRRMGTCRPSEDHRYDGIKRFGGRGRGRGNGMGNKQQKCYQGRSQSSRDSLNIEIAALKERVDFLEKQLETGK